MRRVFTASWLVSGDHCHTVLRQLLRKSYQLRVAAISSRAMVLWIMFYVECV